MGLSEDFWMLLNNESDNTTAKQEAAKMVIEAEDGPEKEGLLSMMYHEGIGVERDLDKAFEHAENAAEHEEGIALYLLGYMCENAETPDQAEGGPRQKYDHYDAERFMERCAKTTSSWSEDAHLWLGDYFSDSARGGDPEIGIEHYEAIASRNQEVDEKLSDYYYDQASFEEFKNEELNQKALKYSQYAATGNPAEYAYRTGWMMAEGVGCKPSFRLARKYLEDAFFTGNWEGAAMISYMFRQRADLENIPQKEREYCLKEANSWHKSAEELRLKNISKEPDNSLDVD